MVDRVYQKSCKYTVEQKNGVRGCYRADSSWHTFFLHSTVYQVHT